MEENINALNEINKGCTMGIQAIEGLIDKVEGKDFRKVLEKELKEYHETEKEVQKLYKKYSDGSPREIGVLTKAMTDYMMNMKTMMDSSDSKIAELLMQGTSMGITEGRRILNNKNITKDVRNILNEFILSQEKSIENIKNFL